MISFDLAAFFDTKAQWARETFGPGYRTAAIIKHIKKELEVEIAAKPTDLEEWVDVILIAMDGAARAGHNGAAFVAMLVNKQTRNLARVWPDWRTMNSQDEPIEHVRTAEEKRTGGMAVERVKQIATFYAEWLADAPLQQRPEFEHLISMTPRLHALLDEGRIEKAMRWLGFMQGALWGMGLFTLDELKEHSRPEVPAPVYSSSGISSGISSSSDSSSRS